MVALSSTALAADSVSMCCPVCKSADVTPLWRASSDEAAQHFVLAEADHERHEALRRHIEVLWCADYCDIAECGACGFGFAWPFIAGDATYYELAYGSSSYPVERWESRRTLAALHHLPVVGARALEIGAGNGAFLDMLPATLVPRDRIVAVEYNAAARAVLAAKGYTALGMDIRDCTFPHALGPFNFVFMSQVLEHMDRTDAVFVQLRALMAPWGHLFITVPNPKRLAFNEHHGGMRDMPPNHIGKWTMAALEVMAERHGFEIVEAERERCSLLEIGRQDAIDHYLRQAQRAGTVANRVRSRPRTRTRRLAEFAVIAAVALSRLPALAEDAFRLHELGASIWIHLRKIQPTSPPT